MLCESASAETASDTHIHASQFPNLGLFGRSTLLDWLQTYTFPTEARYSDLRYARMVYSQCIDRLLSNGTTTASYFTTIHVPATNLLADLALSKGQRAFVGRVCMDRLGGEGYLDESSDQALKATRECMHHINKIDPRHELVDSIITPRFAPSCSGQLLAGLGELHKESGCRIQTHISENTDEVTLVKELFPESTSYADVYDRAGLLGPKTVLAHAIHLTDQEKALVAERKAKISHCPVSNTCLTSGVAPIKALMDAGIDIGLGTDVSGGYSTSILDAVRHAVLVSRHAAMQSGHDGAKLTTAEALYLATRGGAKVLGLHDKVGTFEVGMEWDAQLIHLGDDHNAGHNDNDTDERMSPTGKVDIFGDEQWPDKINKWVYNGDDRNTIAVWVRGRLVHKTLNYDRYV